MKIVFLLCALFVELACFAQSPASNAGLLKAVPVSNMKAALIPSAKKIVVPPKEVYKKKRKSGPVTVVKNSPKPTVSNSK